jgi:hypothetical protein
VLKICAFKILYPVRHFVFRNKKTLALYSLSRIRLADIVKENSKKHNKLYKENRSFCLIKSDSIVVHGFFEYDHGNGAGTYEITEFLSLEDFILCITRDKINIAAISIFGLACRLGWIDEKPASVAKFSKELPKELPKYKDEIAKLPPFLIPKSISQICKNKYTRIIGKSINGIFFRFINKLVFKRVAKSNDFFFLEGIWRDESGDEMRFNLQDKYYTLMYRGKEYRYDFQKIEQYNCLFSVCENGSDLCERTNFILSRDNMSIAVYSNMVSKVYKRAVN